MMTNDAAPQGDDLDVQLLAAHARDDRDALVQLYEQAALSAEAEGHSVAAGFYMTHAYVFALEAGRKDAARLKAWLVAHGRESEQ